MSRATLLMLLAVAALLVGGWMFVAVAQEEEEAPAPRTQQGPRGGQFDPEQMRQRNMDMIKEALGATDEEWKVLGPRVEKVQTLSRQTGGRGMGMMGMMGMMRDRGGRDRQMPAGMRNREQTEVDKALEGLRTVLDDAGAKPEDITAKLTALREAREAAKQELHKARQGLRELLSIRQEAQLVVMGLLE